MELSNIYKAYGLMDYWKACIVFLCAIMHFAQRNKEVQICNDC